MNSTPAAIPVRCLQVVCRPLNDHTKYYKVNKILKHKSGLILIMLIVLFSSCCPFIKAEDLGNNFILSEYDNVDRRIIYSKEKYSGSGIEIVPMTVVEYANNSKWIIAKSSPTRFKTEYQYWIVDKNFNIEIVQANKSSIEFVKSHVYGPFDSTTFINKLFSQKINLVLTKI